MNPRFRDIKRKARRIVHETMAEPALYLAALGSASVGVTIRLHTSIQALGALATGNGYAEVDTITPRIVFMNDQVVPRQNSIIITQDMGAYLIGNVLPRDDITTTAEVSLIPVDQARKQGWDPTLPFMGLPSPSII